MRPTDNLVSQSYWSIKVFSPGSQLVLEKSCLFTSVNHILKEKIGKQNLSIQDHKYIGTSLKQVKKNTPCKKLNKTRDYGMQLQMHCHWHAQMTSSLQMTRILAVLSSLFTGIICITTCQARGGHLGSSGFKLNFSFTSVLMQVLGRRMVLGKGRLLTGLVRLPSFSHAMMAERS